MPVEVGTGVVGNVSYEYHLRSRGWFCTYESRLFKSLVDPKLHKVTIFLPYFQFGGQRWCLAFDTSDDFCLGVYLNNGTNERHSIHRTFTLVNQQDEKKNISAGGMTVINAGVSQGWTKIVPLDFIRDPERGFLVRDSVVWRVDIRLILDDNEYEYVWANARFGFTIWRLKHVYGMSPRDLQKWSLHAGGKCWPITLQPRGWSGSEEHASLIVEYKGDTALRAKIGIVAVNRSDDSASGCFSFEHEFDEPVRIPDFLHMSALRDEGFGFLKDDWFTLVAYVSIPDTEIESDDNSSVSEDSDAVEITVYQLDSKEHRLQRKLSLRASQGLRFGTLKEMAINEIAPEAENVRMGLVQFDNAEESMMLLPQFNLLTKTDLCVGDVCIHEDGSQHPSLHVYLYKEDDDV